MPRRKQRLKTSLPGVERLDRGVYRIRGKYICPKTDRRRELDRVVRAVSPKDADRQRRDLLETLSQRTEAEETRLEDYARSWLTGKLPKLRRSTSVNYATALDLHILPHFGDWFVGRITKADVIEWRDRQKGAPASINGRLRVLKTLLADAVDELGLARNPAKRVAALPSEGKRPKTLDVVTLRAVLDAVRRDAPQWYPLTLALAHTGARFGAVSALEWRDIDWSANTIRFERAHYRGTLAKLKIGDPRVVPLTPELRSVLEAHRLSTKGFDLVFPSGVGGYHTPSVLDDALKRAGTASGAPLVSPHWFRHTWNNLLRQTASKDVQKALTGHSTDAMAEHYAHVSLPEKWEAVNAILAVIDGGKP